MRRTARKLASGLIAVGLCVLTEHGVHAGEKTGTSEVIPVPALAGASDAGVAEVLGKPSRCEPTKYGPKCYYKADAVEIVFINGAADWITIWPRDAAYAASSLGQLGLPQDLAPAFFSTEHGMRWADLEGLREVMAFPRGSVKVRYFYVKARTR